jgi:hypothetical protein
MVPGCVSLDHEGVNFLELLVSILDLEAAEEEVGEVEECEGDEGRLWLVVGWRSVDCPVVDKE